MTDTYARVEQIFTDAGWKPHAAWGNRFMFNQTRIVGGVAPDGAGYLKNPDQITPDHPQYSADTPDEPHEAAAWLVARFGGLAPESKVEDSAGHETHGETGESAEPLSKSTIQENSSHAGRINLEGDAGNMGSGVGLADRGEGRSEPPTDADFEAIDFAAIEGADLGAEILDAELTEPLLIGEDIKDFAPDEVVEEARGAFIFGDNLDQRRTAAIGVVVQMALERMPDVINYARLSELRNFAMGVAEGRWPDDPGKRAELDALEALERQRRMVEAVRDDKVAYLVTATREQIESFDPSEGWP